MNRGRGEIIINERGLTLGEIVDVARGRRGVTISPDPGFAAKIRRSQDVLMAALEKGTAVYGVNTGYGKSCGKRMAMEVSTRNGSNLIRFHGCGTGAAVGIQEVRAAMLTRILCFSRGYSGASMELIRQLAEFLNRGITPVVPCEGSVGASGDLTPLSYIAAALMGEGEVFYRDGRMPAAEALREEGLAPYTFAPKEPLAMMNGTSIMTGIAALVMDRTRRLLDASICATALSIHALMGNAHHYDPVISRAKPHPGQDQVARKISDLLQSSEEPEQLAAATLESLQDPYSLRCSPQILEIGRASCRERV